MYQRPIILQPKRRMHSNGVGTYLFITLLRASSSHFTWLCPSAFKFTANAMASRGVGTCTPFLEAYLQIWAITCWQHDNKMLEDLIQPCPRIIGHHAWARNGPRCRAPPGPLFPFVLALFCLVFTVAIGPQGQEWGLRCLVA